MIVVLIIFVSYLLFAYQGKKTAKNYFQEKWKHLDKEACRIKIGKLAKIDLLCTVVMLIILLFYFFGMIQAVREKYALHLVASMFVLAIPSFIVRGAAQYSMEKFPPESEEQ